MSLLLHLFYGFIMAYLGLIPPGMLNMTTVRTTVTSGRLQGLKFAAGASVIVALHSFLAFTFAEYLTDNPHIIRSLRFLGILVFLLLSAFFFLLARKEFRGEGKKSKHPPFLAGLFMSSINMLGIPFYLGVSAVLESKGKIVLDYPNTLFLVAGATFGAFALFSTYSIFADFISKKVGFIARNINYILSILFLILAIMLFINVI